MLKTAFFHDFAEYYKKAETLERKNTYELPPTTMVNDPLMDSVTIYDTVHRRQAGFSKALQDLWGKRRPSNLARFADYSQKLDSLTFHFLHLFHRFTGSGASFQPTLLPDGSLNPKEHGYCNSLVGELASIAASKKDTAFDNMKSLIVSNTRPMVTSVGNQPPSLKNGDPSKYRLAMQYYFDNFATKFVIDYVVHLVNREYERNQPMGIKEAVDFSCEWHKERGFKQWHFVLTAFVMDTAEYYPELVDPKSHCYYGANCIRGFDLMFLKEPSDPRKKDQWYESCMSELCKAVNGLPYDVEDVVCDVIRYWVEHVPKGYSHLTPEQTKNNSTLKINGVYPLEVQQRIKEIIG